MNKRTIFSAVACALAIGNTSALAGSLSVTDFIAGDSATAASVNNAFAEVETEVNDNDSRITDNEGDITALETEVGPAGSSRIDANEAAIAINTSAISALNSGDCPTNAGDMVKVGSLCVDKYEATIYGAEDRSTGVILPGSLTMCDVTGNECSSGAAEPIFARSDAGVTPTVNISWFQAAQACTNVGKRLITNAEWQTAAAGIPDTNLTDCNVSSAAIADTDANPLCVSNWGVNNMSGNVWEMTADWVQGTAGAASGPNSAAFGSDAAVSINEAGLQGDGDNFMAMIIRGGAFGSGTGAGVFAINTGLAPSAIFNNTGFRCAL